ncbi:hypothetical protein [Nonomuraea cavernae]|uniref:Uncharacterized protein n=1 Tax=Nonomuraea cavernae TaxID=2045107 RepID=A0A918DQF2_9ACTN|nr:hypothetical protein [Nonomuraea cavernae]MCA2189936.1 hypothetical protein [Nonomuraea cavernae]GGO77937.1 hypothetical protein GCM10012289_58770 [Nonomuraea cavernae]
MRSEDDLIRTLRTAADQAGQPVVGLAGAVAARRRTRRVRQRVQRMQVALAAAAVVVVAGGTTAVLTGTGERMEPAVTVATGPPRDERPLPQLKRAAEVWPGAAFKMPAKAADGWRYRPVTGLSATEVLLAAESSFEKAGRLEVFDASTGKTRVVGDMPAPDGVKGYFVQAVDVGEKYFVWYGETPNKPDKWADFWIMPREGGTARRVGKVTGELSHVEKVGVTDDSLVWSLRKGGVYRMPLTGGPAERIDGTDGLHLVSWPLAVAYAPGESDRKNQSRVVDLETGTATDVQAETGTTELTCGPEWCFGVRGERTVMQRLDGSDSRLLPEGLRFFGGGRILGDRFALLDAPLGGDPATRYLPSAVVYDAVTGLAGGISRVQPNGGGGFGAGTSSSPTTIVYWDEDERSEETCGTTEPPMTADVVGISRQDGQVCVTRRKGGGKELTVLNLLAVTAGSG